MSQIRDLMHERLARLEATGGANVDVEAARSTVRRHRRTRTALTSAAAVATTVAVGAGAWLGYTAWTQDVAITPSPTPVESASPSPTPTPTPEPTLRARPINPSEAELLAMAENPATGEVWLAQAEPIDAPTWYTDTLDESQDDQLEGWYRIGERNGRTILIFDDSLYRIYFEVEADGTDPAEVIAPAPHQTPDPEAGEYSDFRVDPDTFYDSLAIFPEWTAPDGLVVRPQEPGRGSLVDTTGLSYVTVREFGGNAVVRVERPLEAEALAHSGAETLAPAIDDRTVGVLYAIRHPFGLLIEAPSAPLPHEGELEFTNPDVGWVAPELDSHWPGHNGFVDFFDDFCGYEHEFWPLAIDEDPAQWTQVGPGPVYTPTLENPLAVASYEVWADPETYRNSDLEPEDAPTLDSYLNAPAILGVPAADDSGWWLLTNLRFSMRAGC